MQFSHLKYFDIKHIKQLKVFMFGNNDVEYYILGFQVLKSSN